MDILKFLFVKSAMHNSHIWVHQWHEFLPILRKKSISSGCDHGFHGFVKLF